MEIYQASELLRYVHKENYELIKITINNTRLIIILLFAVHIYI